MRNHWRHYVRLLVYSLLGCIIVGLIIGSVAWALVFGLTAYLGWTLTQAFRMHRWLYQAKMEDPPESRGLWGDLFDGIHRLQVQHYRSRDRLQAMIDRIQESTNALKDAVVMTNSEGAMDWWNQSAEKLLGFKYPTDRGQLIYNLIRTPIFKRYFASKKYQEPLILNAPNNPNLKLQFHITLFGEDDRLLLVQDVTRLYRLEEMRRDFVSNVSHELRTPLTVISGYLETLIDNADELPPRWNRAMNQMQQQAQRMEALVNDLLLLSRIENDGSNFKATLVDVDSMLRAICDDARALSQEKGHRIELSLESAAGLTGNETQLHSAFSNIVMNAVKYTPPNGEIRVRWFEDKKGVHFAVRDSGIGIDPLHIPRLTERFYRADPSRAADTGGTGLGLAIVKHVLINHDGELEITSHIGAGSTFTCHFPRTRMASAEALAEAEDVRD
ncbi:Signal transduction histidine kinase [Hahella chejuensis KCTC 2396]|uniref:Phosphate regulon sensor protein PhoR n=1 Tax=Hahella chejuensis (strain KCTC 2396) TaxID=349521 RepID=Q2SNV7_HAHCH|nr:phosphate regulon sensor histidine kinase PhoR [Hahella chejuensis]ABC27667.1 Signal transduction histidine kinase [Hahella chejuensis KCTC 2396]